MTKQYHIPRKALALLLFIALQIHTHAQVFAYFNSCIFNTPQNQPYVETYLTISGAALFAKENKEAFRNSVNVGVKIFKDSTLVKANKYNLNGPDFQRGQTAPTFIDIQRYRLPNGDYSVELTLTDNNSLRKKELLIKDKFHVDFSADKIQLSGVEALESFNKTTSPGSLAKSGFDLVPYILDYYPESTKQLSFYLEAYNANKVMGQKTPFVFYYYLETADTKAPLTSFGSFKKQAAEAVNPLLGRIDISVLGTGNYNLAIEMKDQSNIILARKIYPFQRVNRMVDIATLQTLSELELEAQYFGHCNNTDTLKMYVESLWPIADGVDKDRIINQSVKKDGNMMKKFVIDFWQRRAADTVSPVKLWADHYQKVQVVMANFKCGKQPGYYSDRGRVYLQYGAPSQRSQMPNENNTFPYEIWQYYRTTDQTNGQFFSNRKFVFVNKMIGDDCYKLVHSDMRGEINNPRWQFEVTRRNNDGLSNPDNNTPAGTEFNQMNEVFTNPR